MTPEFADVVNPVFRSVLEILARIDRGASANLDESKFHIRDAFHAADGRAKSSGREDDWELAKRALVYWTDEVLTQADSTWENLVFEREFYHTSYRATDFYVYGERDARNSNADVLETWYLTLVLGFIGQIDVAFYESLNRNTLPGDARTPEEARIHWAGELRRHLSRRRPAALDQSPATVDYGYDGDDGSSARITAALLFVILLAVFGGLIYYGWPEIVDLFSETRQ